MTMEKPSKAEEEYFARAEFARRKKEIEAHQAGMAARERTRLKELHYMRCPKCGLELAEIEFQGIKVDRCVACNGTFFDGGEIEELLSKSAGFLTKLAGIFK
jgi:phage FluMu protein Com